MPWRRLPPSLVELGLAPKVAKTRIGHLEEGGEGLDFLGFHHRWVRAGSRQHRHVTFLARWPSKRAMKHARDRIRELTDQRGLLLPVEAIGRDVNRVLRGWAEFFPIRELGSPLRRDQRLRADAPGPGGKRHQRGRAYGWSVVAFQSPDQFGLIDLKGIVVAPRTNRSWREKPKAGGERRR